MKRNCYCKLGQKFCGTCSRCQKPGHVSHAPGDIPSTGTWCDACYQKEFERWKQCTQRK